MMPATLGRGCCRYCSSTKASCCRMNSDLDKPRSPAARVRRAFISGSRAMVVAFLRVSAMEVMLPGEKLNHKAISQSSRSGMRCQPGRVNPEAFRERKGNPRAPDPFRVKNFSRFKRLAVPRAGLEPARALQWQNRIADELAAVRAVWLRAGDEKALRRALLDLLRHLDQSE